MKILQLNLNHCEAAQDLLMQTVRELKPDLVMISEPYRHLGAQTWASDASNKAAIWSCGRYPFQNTISSTEIGFVRANLDNIYFYSYAPPSLSLDEFTDLLNILTKDTKEHSPVTIAGDFHAWAVDWGCRETNRKGQSLLEDMSLLDVVLLNSGDKPTYVRGGANLIVDFIIMSSSFARGNRCWEVINVYMHSDHRAIL